MPVVQFRTIAISPCPPISCTLPAGYSAAKVVPRLIQKNTRQKDRERLTFQLRSNVSHVLLIFICRGEGRVGDGARRAHGDLFSWVPQRDGSVLSADLNLRALR